MRIVFMGTPEFAVPTLDILLKNNFDIAAVITAPDKPAGRGQQLSQSAVKKYALAAGLPILQPTNLKNPEFIAQLKALDADIQVVVAFRMLPAAIYGMPPKGCINLHASLLPQYRGAAPINWAVINGEATTGLTTFFIVEAIDTGQIIFQTPIEIAPDDTAGSLHDRMLKPGAELMLKTVRAIEAGNAPSRPQNLEEMTHAAPKIYTETCQIDWEKNARQLYNFIRGLSPYPTALSILNGQVLKVYAVARTGQATEMPAGSLYTDGKKQLWVATADEWLALVDIQLQGKKKMSAEEFLRGYRGELLKLG